MEGNKTIVDKNVNAKLNIVSWISLPNSASSF